MELTSNNEAKAIRINQDISVTDKYLDVETGAIIFFCGGRILNNADPHSTIIVSGDDVTIIAPPQHIFVGEFVFRGKRTKLLNPEYPGDGTQPEYIYIDNQNPAKWTMERAYPQWFGAKSCAVEAYAAYKKLKKMASKKVGNTYQYYVKDNYTQLAAEGLGELNAIPDASAAINAAIRLKQRGEVFIPRGWYKLSRHINVLPGIKLVGESTSDSGGFLNYGTTLFPWVSSLNLSDWNLLIPPPLSDTDREFNLSSLRFPWHPNHCNWYADFEFRRLMKETGYMITVNIDEELKTHYTGGTSGEQQGGEPTLNPNPGQGISYEESLLMRNVAPDSVTYQAIQKTPPPETEIRDIRLVDLNNIYSTNYNVATHINTGTGGQVNLTDRDAEVVEWEKQNVHYHPLVEPGVAENWEDYDYRFMRGILVAYSVHLKNVHVTGLSHAVCSISSFYADARHIEGCIFSPPHFNLLEDPYTNSGIFSFTPDNLDALYPEKLYAFDLSSSGDALRFDGNHVVNYCDMIGALHLSHCNGGSITGNILNSDVMIENSRGVDFASNHMEYGATFTVATSAVSVRDNYIWRGERPAITLRRSLGDAYNLSHWSAELSNNQLFWRSQHIPGEPQAAQSVYPYDIRTDGYGTLDIHNTFHTSSRLGPAEGSYFGLKMERLEIHRYAINNDHATEVGFSEETASKEPFEEFNRISHIASASSHIEGHNVTPMPKSISAAELARGRDCYSTSQLHFDADLAKVDEKDRWKINEEALDEEHQCTYKYKAWIYADYSRRLLIPNPYPYSSQEQNCPEAIILDPKYDNEKIDHLQPDPIYSENATNKKYYNLRLLLGRGERSNMDVPIGPFWMYIERTAIKDNQVLNTKTVTIPVTSSCIFWDDGEYLSGYAWSDEINSDPASTYNLQPSRVVYHGSNVECICDYEVPKCVDTNGPQLNGSWLEGDIVREMVNGAVVSWLKTVSGWKTI